MHQDYHYFPYDTDSIVAIFIHLHDSDVEEGSFERHEYEQLFS